jgi:gliding motility-associated-like protein
MDIKTGPELIPAFTAFPERQVLPNKTVILTNSTNTGPWTYKWDMGDGQFSSDPNLTTYEFNTYGIYQITLNISYGSCSNETSKTVVIEPVTPVVDFKADILSGCRPLTVKFTNLTQFADPNTYFWEFGNNLGTSNAVNPTFTFYDPGTYSVKLQATNELGILVTEEKDTMIDVNEVPIAAFTVRPSIVYIPNQPAFTSNLSVGGQTYTWNFGDGTADTVEYEPQHYYTKKGIYDISLKVENEFGCIDSLTQEKAVEAEIGGEVNTPNVFTPNPNGPGGGTPTPGNPAFNDVFLPVEEGVVQFHMQIFNRWGEMLFESYEKNKGWDGYYNGKMVQSDVYIYRLDLKLNDGRRVTRLGDITLIR